MAICYTSRKGITYNLCKAATPSGKPRYFFARTPKGELVEQIPAGYTISESVNGVVSLAKTRPSHIRPDEIATIQATLNCHSMGHYYRLNVRADQIEVYEPIGPTPDEIVADLLQLGLVTHNPTDAAQTEFDQRAQFTPVLRFILIDAQTRQFRAERMCHRSQFDGWCNIHRVGQLKALANEIIPMLGTSAFFEL
jgi:hypothetical protein